jgi:hypothetical protein
MIDRLFNKPLESARRCLKHIVQFKAAANSPPNKTPPQAKTLGLLVTQS